ncbi:MAG: single-stranded DNA-binding protein [Candidatus Magasanikbacteria bacterium]
MDLNRATILGRLTRDPEVRTTPSGQSVATIGIATNRVWTDNTGVRQERVEYHNCVLWGKLADIAGQYLSKGRRVYVEGRIETRDWTGQDGVKRYRTEIIAENLIMLDAPRSSSAQGSDVPPPPSGSSSQPTSHVSDEEIKVEDIPF